MKLPVQTLLTFGLYCSSRDANMDLRDQLATKLFRITSKANVADQDPGCVIKAGKVKLMALMP